MECSGSWTAGQGTYLARYNTTGYSNSLSLPPHFLSIPHDDTTPFVICLLPSQLPPLPRNSHPSTQLCFLVENERTVQGLRQGRILVSEGAVLFGVQNLQEGSCWVTLQTLLLEKERGRGGGINSIVSFFHRAGLTSLSTSSSRKTGLFTPTVFNPWMILPGMEPMYVRLQGKKNNRRHLNPIPVLF